jgi:hypothetical protein
MRYLAYALDPVNGGSSLEDLIAAGAGPDPTWEDPDEFVPASAAQAEPGIQNVDRNAQVVGGRARRAPVSFASMPSSTFSVLAHPKITKALMLAAFSGAITSDAGTVDPDEAITSQIVPTDRDGQLRALQLWLLREEQLDRLSGVVVEEITANFPIDGEGTLDATLQALYHDVDPSGSVVHPDPSFVGYDETFMLRDVTAFLGAGAGVEVDCLAGLGFTFNNGLSGNMRDRFCGGKNIQTTVLDGVRHKLWYPDKHRVGPQVATMRLDFGTTRPDRELRHILSHAEKIVAEFSAGPLATTPAADEMMRLTFLKAAPLEGQAEPLTQDDQQVSSYTYTAFLDEDTGGDIIAEFTGETVLGA